MNNFPHLLSYAYLNGEILYSLNDYHWTKNVCDARIFTSEKEHQMNVSLCNNNAYFSMVCWVMPDIETLVVL